MRNSIEKWHACLGSHTKTFEKLLLRSCCYKVEAEALVMELVYFLLGNVVGEAVVVLLL